MKTVIKYVLAAATLTMLNTCAINATISGQTKDGVPYNIPINIQK